MKLTSTSLVLFSLLFFLGFNLSCSSTSSSPTTQDSAEAQILDPAPLPACGFTELEFKSVKQKKLSKLEATTAGFTVEVGSQPVVVTQKSNQQTCKTNFSKVSQRGAWELTGTDQLLFRYQSGKDQKMALIDGKTCTPVWESNIHQNSTVGEARIMLQSKCKPGCDEKGDRKKCDCPPDEVWVLDAECKIKQVTN